MNPNTNPLQTRSKYNNLHQHQQYNETNTGSIDQFFQQFAHQKISKKQEKSNNTNLYLKPKSIDLGRKRVQPNTSYDDNQSVGSSHSSKSRNNSKSS